MPRAQHAIEIVICTQSQVCTIFRSFSFFRSHFLFDFFSARQLVELVRRQNKTRTIKINMKHSVVLNAPFKLARTCACSLLQQLSNHSATSSRCVRAIIANDLITVRSWWHTAAAKSFHAMKTRDAICICIFSPSAVFKWIQMTEHRGILNLFRSLHTDFHSPGT